MAKFLWRRAYGLVPAALALGWLAAGISAKALGEFTEANPILLNPKTAGRLLVNQVLPDYPAVAKLNYIQGTVRLQLIVTSEGRIGEAHVVEGHPFLAASALKAIRRWVYHPFITPSGPTAFQTFVDIKFTLHPRKIDRLPDRPERDLTQRVQPPRILQKPADPTPAASVRLRILVGDSGKAMDSQPMGGQAAYFRAARKLIETWTFQPARWGALFVPWYLEVDVPVESPHAQHSAADPSGR